MNANVMITANKKVYQDGKNAYEVKVDGMEGKLQCVKNFTDPLKAMRYMWMLSKRLELDIDSISLATVSIAYRRAKEAEAKAIEDARTALAEVEAEQEAEPQKEASKESVEEPAPEALPIIEQYRKMKESNPDAVLLFRCGDFYESYEEDAKILAEVLGITLTRRSSDNLQMAGFPYHALDSYLPRLIRSGHRCAICDEVVQSPKRRGRKPKAEAEA